MEQPSRWIEAHAGLVPDGPVLDVACGGGRHTWFFLRRGHAVTAVDRDTAALRSALGDAAGLTVVDADLEDGTPFPFAPGSFAGVVVTNYLWRPILTAITACVAPGGALLYETFAQGNERFGKPSNPAFLLAPDELLEVAHDGRLHVVAFEDRVVDTPRPAAVQRIAATRP
ncbi:MAG: class I SAM-dependent methyltransferase [Acidimicrobiia bacterium]